MTASFSFFDPLLFLPLYHFWSSKEILQRKRERTKSTGVACYCCQIMKFSMTYFNSTFIIQHLSVNVIGSVGTAGRVGLKFSTHHYFRVSLVGLKSSTQCYFRANFQIKAKVPVLRAAFPTAETKKCPKTLGIRREEHFCRLLIRNIYFSPIKRWTLGKMLVG